MLPVSAEETPSLSARSAILIDADTGGVILEKNADERLPMASTTKIITALVALENGTPDDPVCVSANAAGTEGSSVYLAAGETLSLRDLLYGLMLESGNDAAVAIAEHIGGSEEAFVRMMNGFCSRIGAHDTHCVTPNGLDAEEHYTTARDLAHIAAYAMKNLQFREIVSRKEETIPDRDPGGVRYLSNHNKLLKTYDGADGIKTGYTSKSGRCLVSSASRNGWRVIAVTLNAPDDWNDHGKLLDYAFMHPDDTCVLSASDCCGFLSVPESRKNTLPFGPSEDCFLKTIIADRNNVEVRTQTEERKAPIAKGTRVGNASVFVAGTFYKNVPLIALETAKRDNAAYIITKNFRLLLYTLLNITR